jgi:hypothetical protein
MELTDFVLPLKQVALIHYLLLKEIDMAFGIGDLPGMKLLENLPGMKLLENLPGVKLAEEAIGKLKPEGDIQ